MCGITGFINYKSSELNIRNTIQKMTYSIEHRGPDNIGSWLDSNDGIALGHSRLSIIDLSANGNQPMVSKCSRYVIVYNGELYNNNKLRHELEISIDGKNTKWNSHSDTETIIECISFYGVEKTLMKINGMFAMAVWDKKEKKLFLGRDRIGEKPLYYGWGNGVFIFGSELKSLKENSMFSLEIDRNALSQYMRLSYVPTPLSIYKNCNKLSPGSFLTIHLEGANENDYKISKYWELSIENNYKSYDDVNFEEKVINQLETSIQSQMVSDVPIGAFLSGGIDSTLVVALMQKNSLNPINTFTIGYDYQNLNEANYAKEIANYLGTNHTEQYVTKRDALGVIPNLSHIYDEPFGDSSQIPTTLVSVLAKDKVKVVLTGDGADELFAGYPRYILTHRLWRVLNNIPMGIRESFSSMLNCYPYELLNKIFTLFFSRDLLTKSKKNKISYLLKNNNLRNFYYEIISHTSGIDNIVLGSKTNINSAGSIFNRDNTKYFGIERYLQYLDIHSYLPDDILTKVDRAAMSVSLETRVPFLDYKLVEYAFQLPRNKLIKNKNGKLILKKELDKYVPRRLTERPKMGFGIPLQEWLAGPLNDWANDLLSEKVIKEQGYLDYELVNKIWNRCKKDNSHSLIWNILMFQNWLTSK